MLDPLKFQVAIQDKATEQLQTIENEFKKLKDKTISVKVEGLEELRSLLALLNQKQPSGMGSTVSQEVEKATSALKEEEEALERLKKAAKDVNIGSAVGDNLNKVKSNLDYIESSLERIAKEKANAEKTIASLRDLYGGQSPYNAKAIDAPGMKKAIEEDRKEQEKNVAELDKKWEAYWEKQEQEAQRFATICQKSLKDINMDDFYKHIFGPAQSGTAAKAWLRTYVRDNYGSYFGKDGDLYKDMSAMRSMSRHGTATKEMEEELKVLEAYQQKYNEFWRQRNAAESATPRQDAAYEEHRKAQQSFLDSQSQILAAKENEKNLLAKQAEEQKKLNELNAQAAAESQKKAQADAAVVAQEEKVAQAKEKLAQATQAQAQANQQNTQAEQKQSQEINVTGNAMQRLNEQYRQMAEGAIKTALDALTKDLKAAKDAMQQTNFATFAERIEKCATAVNALDEAFKKFNLTIGQNEGMKNFMTGLGEVISNVRMTMAPLAQQTQGALGFDAMRKSINVASNEAEHMQNVLRQLQRTIDRFGANDVYSSPRMKKYNGDGLGFDTTRLEKYKDLLLIIRNELLAIGKNGGIHPVTGLTASQYLGQEDVKRTLSLLNEELGLYKQIGAEMERMTRLRAQLADILSRNPNSSYRGDIENLMYGLDLRMGLLGRLGSEDGLNSMKLNSFFTNDYRDQLAAVPALIKAVSDEQKNNTQATKQAQGENDKWAESIRRASVELPKLEQSIRSLQVVEKAASAAGIDTTKLSAQIAELQNLQRILESIAGGAKLHGTAGEFINSAQYQNTVRAAKEEADAVKKATTEKERSSKASQELTSEEQRLAQAMNRTTQSANTQSQVLSNLKSMAAQYLGVWGGQQFLNNIIEIGGQLEMQRLSIGAILQNTAQANELFDRIKGLATQSPFGVVQLDQMTKQLTAYGFKYNELYDMTKRLADISAATGTDVSRLALALGHVRSEAALSGYTLRQFSMANVPLLQKLSEKLGKTTKEIRDMVRKKDIGYEDVVGVLKDLTDEGGMFHNMQEVISESVKAKFKNVKDAMDIMYGEMAEGAPGDALKEVATVLMELTRNWKDVATVMGSAAGVWAIHRAAVLLFNTALGSNTAAVATNILSYKQKRAVELQHEALTRKLTAEELALVNTRKQITAANMRVALSTNAITKGEALRLVGLRKLSLQEAIALIRSGEFTVAEVRMAREGRILGFNLKMLGRNFEFAGFKMGWAGMMLKTFTLNIKAALTALLTNPLTWVMAGVTAIMELWQRNSRELEASQELSDKIYNRSQEALKNTRQMLLDTGIKVEWRTVENGKEKLSDVTGNFGGQLGDANQWNLPEYKGNRQWTLPEFDESDADANIERWAQYIREYAATPNKILNDAFFDAEENLREKKDQWTRLLSSVIDVAQAQDLLQGLGDAFANAVDATNGGWFDDSVLTNIADYDKELKNFDKNIAKTYRNFRVSVDIGIKAARAQDKEFDKEAAKLGTYAQQFDYLVKNQDKYAEATKAFKNVNANPLAELNTDKLGITDITDVQRQRATMKADLESFYIQLEAELETKGVKVSSMSTAQQQALLLGYKDKLSSIQGLSETTANELMELFAERFKIELDVKDEKFRVKVSEAIRLLRGLSDSEWNVTMNFATTINDVIEEARKQYKAAKDYYENAKPIMLKFGIKAEMGQAFSDEEIDKMVNQSIPSVLNTPEAQAQRDLLRQTLKAWSEASRLYNQATKASENGGFTLEEDKKKDKTSGAYKDEFAKRWDERIRIMKEAHDWYRKWEKEVGHDEAIKETFAKYQDIFKEWKEDKILPLDFDVNDIDDFQKYVEKIYKDALDRYNKQKNNKEQNYGQEAQRVYRQAAAVLEDIKFDNFKEAAEQFRSIIDQTIEDINERWDIFDAVRDATGNVQTAGRIAGFGAAETGARNSADAMRNELRRLMRDAGGDYLLSQMMPFDARLDEESLRTKFENAIPKTGDAERYKEKIDGLIKAYQEWQKLQQKVEKDDATVYAKLIGSVVSYDAQIGKLQDKLTQQKESNKALVAAGTISQSDADRADEMAQAQFDWEKMKLSADYANIYNDAIAMSRTEFDNAAKAIENMLDKLHELGLISPEDYISERGKLDNARTEWSTTGFLGEKGAVGSFITGGNDGLMNYYAGRKNTALRKAEESTDPAEKKKWKQEADHYGTLFQRMSKLSDSAKDVITAFSTLQSGLDLVGGMFDSLGMEGAANAAGDAAGILGSGLSGAQSLSSLGPWGMAAGAAMGLVSGIAQTHDKALERQIGKLREDVQQIEANTKLIQQARERTLGFDTGALRQTYSQQYKPDSELLASFGKSAFMQQFLRAGFLSRAQKDMYEYYTKNSSGTGYQQEYQNLLAQRKDYLDILEKQESKKKKSQSDIEETKSKIAELDDQIRYFTDDLAKELFDIDIKGWADELSDALASAFENGEDMAKAYRDTVTSILQQVASKMMKMSIIEPMFQTLQDRLFGNTEKKISGVFNPNDPKGSLGKVTSMITDFFGKGGEGEKTITAATEFMAAFQRGVQNAGLTVLNESSNTLSSGIQGTSEETSDLLASYVNALRQDVSANRILATQFVSEMWPSYIEQVSSIVNATNRIDGNVAAIRALLSENGTLYVLIDSMKSHFDNITNGNERVTVQ